MPTTEDLTKEFWERLEKSGRRLAVIGRFSSKEPATYLFSNTNPEAERSLSAEDLFAELEPTLCGDAEDGVTLLFGDQERSGFLMRTPLEAPDAERKFNIVVDSPLLKSTVETSWASAQHFGEQQFRKLISSLDTLTAFSGQKFVSALLDVVRKFIYRDARRWGRKTNMRVLAAKFRNFLKADLEAQSLILRLMTCFDQDEADAARGLETYFANLADPQSAGFAIEHFEPQVKMLSASVVRLKKALYEQEDEVMEMLRAEYTETPARFQYFELPGVDTGLAACFKTYLLEGVRQILDPGTVMLSYSVGEKQTDLFILTRKGPLQVHSVEIGKEPLKRQLAKYGNQLSSLGGRHAQGRFEMAKWFFRELIEPASEIIGKNDRVLLVPDGPLHRLPFAALIRETASEQEGDDERGWQYLVEWKPLHTVLSGTVYSELRKLRRPLTKPRVGNPPLVALAAFGDPDYSRAYAEGGSRDATEDVYVRAISERRDFKPLPYTRTEVETIVGLFGSQPVRTYLGKEATEERAKSLSNDVRIVHFATHGYLNDEFPLNTALALTIPEQFVEGRENGLLQVWEIFERVRLDADLVVLSACDTADGEEQFGEGLIGLSRAFQYAGARSVLATLWSVPDRTTAELMTRFYRHLLSGKAFDESLRAAQIELIRGEVKTNSGHPASEPFYWAAFQVIGDWK